MVKILGIQEPYGARIQKKFGRDWENLLLETPALLQESGDFLLLENGLKIIFERGFLLQENLSKIRLELGWPEFLLQENRSCVLQENGGKIKFDFAYAYSAFGVYKLTNCKEGKISTKGKFYKPWNQTQPNKVISQQKFADAGAGWQSLTAEQKISYNKREKNLNMSGYNLYIREFMQI